MAQRKGIIKEIEGRSGTFAVSFLFLFALTFGFLALVGATPNPPGKSEDITTQSTTTQATPNSPNSPEAPVRIVIKKTNLDTIISNPNSTDIDVLDLALKKGAVRYPTSAVLGVNGTVLLFGHSSYLPIVYNQNYKTFDGIQNLKTGDVVSVYSADKEYRYSVVGVKIADANSDIIPLPNDAKYLTLVTCDSFATKSNRFIVTANFIGAYDLTQ